MEIGNNIKSEFSLLDKSITKKSSKCFKLFADYNNYSFSYSLYNIEKNEFQSVHSYIFEKNNSNLKYLFNFSKMLKWNLNSFTISYFFKPCTIIPNSLYDSKLKRKYLELNNQIDSNEEVLVDKLKYLNAVIIYSIPKEHLSILKKIKNIKLRHSATIFIENILKKTKHSNNNEFFIDISTKNFNIAFIKNSKLVFYNNFEFKSKDDFLYYILNCYNTLEINSREVKVRISGEFEKNSVISDLKSYIKKVLLVNRSSSNSYSYILNQVPNHFFQKLFNQINCE